MNCPRCHGYVIPEVSHDALEGAESKWPHHKCVNCGHYTDFVIELNRAKQRLETAHDN